MADKDDKQDEIIKMAKESGMALNEINDIIAGIEEGGHAAEMAFESLTEKIRDSSASANASAQEQLKFEQQRLENLKFIVNEKIKANQVDKIEAGLLEEEIKKQERKLEIAQDTLEQEKASLKWKETSLYVTQKILETAKKVPQLLGSAMGKMNGLVGGLSQFKSGISSAAQSVFSSVLQVLFKFDNATKAMQKGIGGTQMNSELLAARGAAYGAGMGLQEFNSAVITLNDSSMSFSQQNKETRREMATTVALLDNLGFSADASAAGIDMATKAMGQTATEATKSLRSIRLFSKEIGISPKRASAMFKGNLSALSQYGKKYTKVFKEMALATKNTGVEMDKLLGVTEKFMTFEGAAKAAGDLNMMLGSNFIDATQLMAANAESPIKALGLIQDAVKKSGKSLESMSVFERRAIAEAAGFNNVGDMMATLNNELDKGNKSLSKQSVSNKELAKEGRKNLSAQEALTRAIESIAATFMPEIMWGLKQIFKLLKFVKSVFTGKSIFGETGAEVARLVVKFLVFAAIAGKILGPLKMIGGIFMTWPGLLILAAGAIATYFFGFDNVLGGIKDAFSWIKDAAKDAMTWLGQSSKTKSKKGKKDSKTGATPGLSMATMPPGLKQKVEQVKQKFEDFGNFLKNHWGKILLGAVVVIGGVIFALRWLKKTLSPIKGLLWALAATFIAFGLAIWLAFEGASSFLTVWDSISSGFSGGMMIVIILGLLIGGFILMAKTVDKMDVVKLGLFAASLFALGIAIGALLFGLSLFFTVMKDVDAGTITGGVIAIAAVLGILVAAAYALGNPVVQAGMAALSLGIVALGVAFVLLGAGVMLAGIGMGLFVMAINAMDGKKIGLFITGIYGISASMLALGAAGFALIPGAVGVALMAAALWFLSSTMGDLSKPETLEAIRVFGEVIEGIIKTTGELTKPIDALKQLISTLDTIGPLRLIEIGVAIGGGLVADGLLHKFRDFFEVLNDAGTKWQTTFALLNSSLMAFPQSTAEAITSSVNNLRDSFSKPISSNFVRSLAKVVTELKRLNMEDIEKLNMLSVVELENSSEGTNLKKASQRKTDAYMNVTIYMPLNINGRVFKDAFEQEAEAKLVGALGKVTVGR